MNIETMSVSQLVKYHNNLTKKPLASWKGKKTDLIARIAKLAPAAPAPVIPAARIAAPAPLPPKTATVKPARKKTAATAKRSKKAGIGDFCRAQIGKIIHYQNTNGKRCAELDKDSQAVGLSYDEILASAVEKFPSSAVNYAHLRWYASKMRESGDFVPSYRRRVRGEQQ